MKDLIKLIAKDKPLLTVVVVLFVVSLMCAVYFLIKLNPSDLQVSIKYTAFGTEHIYSSHWTYMLSFVGFCVAIPSIHVIIMGKLYRLKNRRFALFLGWASVIIILIAFAILYRIINIAGRN